MVPEYLTRAGVALVDHEPDRAVIVSDLHCTSMPCEHCDTMRRLVVKEGASTLIVLGDLFNNYHVPVPCRGAALARGSC